MWKKQTDPNHPEWVEMHREAVIPGFGKSMLKVWKSGGGRYRFSVRSANCNRYSVSFLGSKSMENAIAEVDKLYGLA